MDLLIRVPHVADVRSIHVRSTPDAEPAFTAAQVDRTTERDTWWRAPLAMHNPVMNDFCSFEGKTEVVQVVAPTVTCTGTDPKPPCLPVVSSSISSVTSKGSVTKYHEAGPSPCHFHSGASNRNTITAG